MSAILLQRITELGAQVLELDESNERFDQRHKTDLETMFVLEEENAELKSHIERFRETFNSPAMESVDVIVVLNDTPKQSLALHDCEVIEKAVGNMKKHGLFHYEHKKVILVNDILEYAEQLKKGK